MFKIFINFLKILEIINNNQEYIVGNFLKTHGKTIAVTESCTGGLISSLLTDISGSSDYIFANFVTYSNEAKVKILNVSENTINKYGAVSEQTAKEMAVGLLKTTKSDYAIATTGIAGPAGGSIQKPVGLMYVGIADKNDVKVIEIRQPKVLHRRIMKLIFAKAALKELYNFMKRGIKNENNNFN